MSATVLTELGSEAPSHVPTTFHGRRPNWLEAWIRDSLHPAVPAVAVVVAEDVSPDEVQIEIPRGMHGAVGHRLSSITVRFDQGVHCSLAVANPEARRVMGQRLKALFELTLRQRELTGKDLDEALVLYVDSSVVASPAEPDAENVPL